MKGRRKKITKPFSDKDHIELRNDMDASIGDILSKKRTQVRGPRKMTKRNYDQDKMVNETMKINK